MAKMPYTEAEKLLAAGVISQDTFDKWLESGWITKPQKQNTIYYLEDAEGNKVTLKYNFSSLEEETSKGFRAKHTARMREMCNKIDEIIQTYGVKYERN